MARLPIILSAFLALSLSAAAQDVESFTGICSELSSSRYQGRGYARNGVRKAGRYIAAQFKAAGADEVSMQPFKLDVNTFPGVMRMSVDGRELTPGSEFVMREYSVGVKGDFPLYFIDMENYDSERLFADLQKPENAGCMVVADFMFTYKHKQDFRRLESRDGAPNTGVVYRWETPLKFYKAYAEKVSDKPIVWVSPEFPMDSRRVSLNVRNRFFEGYENSNVIAKVEGRRHDSCYVFTAHYDHLGNLGRKLFFPGANDNASGTASIITLAGYYSANRPEFDMYFIAFAGEDANLRGSTYQIEHPSMPLQSVRYLFNLDMVADNNPVQYCEVGGNGGDEGFALMQEINSRDGLFKELERGELAANSDHWPYAQKGVPCILFENESGSAFPYYHTAEDDMSHFYTCTYERLFKLVTSFIAENDR